MPPLHTVTILFRPKWEPTKVVVTGEFDEWSQSTVMHKRWVKGEVEFHANVEVEWGKTVMYKFVVDGHWHWDDTQPTITDASGNINNFIRTPPPPKRTWSDVVKNQWSFDVAPAAESKPEDPHNVPVFLKDMALEPEAEDDDDELAKVEEVKPVSPAKPAPIETKPTKTTTGTLGHPTPQTSPDHSPERSRAGTRDLTLSPTAEFVVPLSPESSPPRSPQAHRDRGPVRRLSASRRDLGLGNMGEKHVAVHAHAPVGNVPPAVEIKRRNSKVKTNKGAMF